MNRRNLESDLKWDLKKTGGKSRNRVEEGKGFKRGRGGGRDELLLL